MKQNLKISLLLIVLYGVMISLASCEADQILYNPDIALEEEEEEMEGEEEEEEEEESGDPSGELSDRSTWTIASFSSEQLAGENTGLANAIIDNDIETYWHSCYTGDCEDAAHPHVITIDMGGIGAVDGLEFIQRQSGTRQINEFEVLLSLDNETFTTAGNFVLEDGNLAPQIIQFDAQEAGFIQIVINSTHDESRFAALAEVNAFVSDFMAGATGGGSVPTGMLATDRSSWTIVSSSSEQEFGENTGLANAILDGDLETYWHSCYSGDCADAAYPHQITVDMGEVFDISGVAIAQRQTLSRAVRDFDVEVSVDNENFEVVSTSELENIVDLQTIAFEAVNARYVRLVMNSSYDGDRFAALAEANFYIADATDMSGGTGELFDRSNWTIASFSSEQPGGENTGLANAILDGDLETYWHSCYSGDCADAVYPHQITIDMGEELSVSGVQIAQRGTLSRAVDGLTIEISSDNQTFSPVGDFNLENAPGPQNLNFEAVQTGRYVRLVMTSSFDGDRFAAMAEFAAY